MAITHKINMRWSNDSANINGTLMQSAESEMNQDITVPAEGDKVTDMVVVKDRIKSVYLIADRDVTLTTIGEDEESATTIVLKAFAPVGWQDDTGQECPFLGDFNQLGFENANDDPAVVNIRLLYDSTP